MCMCVWEAKGRIPYSKMVASMRLGERPLLSLPYEKMAGLAGWAGMEPDGGGGSARGGARAAAGGAGAGARGEAGLCASCRNSVGPDRVYTGLIAHPSALSLRVPRVRAETLPCTISRRFHPRSFLFLLQQVRKASQTQSGLSAACIFLVFVSEKM